MSESPAPEAPDEYTVSVLLERRVARSGRWEQIQWDVVGAVIGEQAGRTRGRVLVHEDGEERRYLCTGLVLRLHKDGCEGYWFNLSSGRPYLFVACHEAGDPTTGESEPAPVFVTANHDEATGFLETDTPVFSVPMPDPIREWVERFVAEHYRPEVKRKRKRRDWFQEAEDAHAARPREDKLH